MIQECKAIGKPDLPRCFYIINTALFISGNQLVIINIGSDIVVVHLEVSQDFTGKTFYWAIAMEFDLNFHSPSIVTLSLKFDILLVWLFVIKLDMIIKLTYTHGFWRIFELLAIFMSDMFKK